MTRSRLNLIVIRVANLERAGEFYALLGLGFERHTHGKGPEHLAAEDQGMVFELYPASEKQPVSSSTRIGFAVEDVDALFQVLTAVPGAKSVAEPQDSEWGRRAGVADPDGHRIELTEFISF